LNDNPPTLLYCHCRYSQVVPAVVKEAVLEELCASGLPFEAVPDLCELSARCDPSLQRLATGPLKIAACYPRAVKWLFAAANAPLPQESCEVLNMRTLPASEVMAGLQTTSLNPNLPVRTAPPEVAEAGRAISPTAPDVS
jgi:hypothetical protein